MPSTYTEREVAQIIERAVARQAEARRREGTVGLSMDEIERLGHEVGIDPEHLRAAAAEVDAGAAEHASRRTATHIHVERWTAGPLDTHDWEDATDVLRERLGTDYGPAYGRTDSGKTVETGHTKTWEHTSGLGVHTRVTVSERGDRTRIRVDQQVGIASSPVEGALYGLFSMFLFGPLAFWLGGSVADGGLGTGLSVALALVLFAAASFGIYKADVRWREKKHRRLDALSQELAALLAPTGPVATASVATAQPAAVRDEPITQAPRLSLDALPDALETDAEAERQRDRA